MSLLNQIQTS